MKGAVNNKAVSLLLTASTFILEATLDSEWAAGNLFWFVRSADIPAILPYWQPDTKHGHSKWKTEKGKQVGWFSWFVDSAVDTKVMDLSPKLGQRRTKS